MKKIKATLTPEQIQCLKNQTFSDNEPGTLLKDFSTLLDFIGSTGIPVSGKNHLIAIKLLPQLNQLMSTSFRREAETTPAKILSSHQWLVSFAESIRINANRS